MARFGLKVCLTTLAVGTLLPGGKGWWSRGEDRFFPDYRSRFNDLAGLWLARV
jgi:hypothetical protein